MNLKDQTTQHCVVTLQSKQGEILHTLSVRKGSNLWVVLRKHNIPVGASCSGVGVCGACDVHIVRGKTRAEQNDFESQTLARNHKAPDARLACLCRISEDISVTAEYW